MGNPYANGLNSNLVNRSVLQNNTTIDKCENCGSVSNVDNADNSTNKTKKYRAKRAKNIDTYSDITVQSNINTMGDSKISKFFKEKFVNLRNKIKNRRDVKDQNNTHETINADQLNPDQYSSNNSQTNEIDISNDQLITPEIILDNHDEIVKPSQEHDIKAH
jgi:hypothetical protein